MTPGFAVRNAAEVRHVTDCAHLAFHSFGIASVVKGNLKLSMVLSMKYMDYLGVPRCMLTTNIRASQTLILSHGSGEQN